MSAADFKFATITKAEPNWRALMARRDGSMSLVVIDSWGVPRNQLTQPSPLDSVGEDLSKCDNFVYVIDPNFPLTAEQMRDAAARKARELHWI